jgi:RecB family exonuclease
MNPLDYVSAEVPEGCKVKISPSSFGTFIERPWMWYRQQVLGLDKFEYSTSSVIGTIVHYVAEQVALGNEVSETHIEEYIEKHEENENYCKDTVSSNWYAMAAELVNTYTLPNKRNILEVEKQVSAQLVDGVFPAGTLDLLEGTMEDCMLVDYKTYNSKTKPKAITSVYKYQLLTYVWILRRLGYNVTRIRLVYVNRNIDGGLSEKTGKPLKSYPPEVTELTEIVTEEDLEFIKSQLVLCAETLDATEKHPELTHVIWHDGRLKDFVN